jgi:uncharacterized protein YfaP (DUF2135 family)
MYVAKEQAQFLAAIQATYTAQLAANTDYPTDALENYETVLSEAGWAGCAPPLVCVDCPGSEGQEPCLEHTGGAHECHAHEEYLVEGQSNADTFRCLDGSCILQAGRCNGANNCADGSDETGCDADSNHFVPAYLSRSFTRPADFHNDVHFTCASGQVIEKVGMCNGIDNCADGSDEGACSGSIQVTVEATSGRTVTVETLQSSTGVFHDRQYAFDSLGHFTGKTFIKYSNDDKAIDHEHVMMKLRTLEPLTVYILKLDTVSLPWLETEGFRPSSFTGVSFSGVRETRHKEWDASLLTEDHFAASGVYSKTFPAGTISVPGNAGMDGGFLIFLDRPSTEDEYDNRLSAYWEHGNCGVHGNDWNWHWCGTTAGNCPLIVATDLCPSGEAELAAYHGTGEAYSYHRDGCDYFWHAQYRCLPVPEVMGEELFIGCFVDDGARDLGAMVGNRDNSATNTFELCRAACGDSTYMSLQYGGECFCSNSYGNGAQYVEVDESECNANVNPCSRTSYNCGGTWRQAVYQINNFDHWDLIAHHDLSAGWFTSSQRATFLANENNPDAGIFMNVGGLNQELYLQNSRYHLKIVYTGVEDAAGQCNDGASLGPDGTQEFEWTQTSWITETSTAGYSAISSNSLDYSPHDGCIFSGVARSSTSATILDGSSNHGNWFHSIGSTQQWNNGIPAFKGGAAQGMSLYIKRPSAVEPEPESECGPLPELTHAMWTHGLQYHCEEGYSFDGSALTANVALQVECFPTGLYTPVRVCVPVNDCLGHSCGAFGTCRDLHMDYTCDCASGYEMHVEEQSGEKMCGNIDDCGGHLCGEAGICVDLVNDYECNCGTGWRQVVRHEDDLKTCERVECGEIPSVDNVMSMEASGNFPWTRSKAVFEDTVDFTCQPGYSTNGERTGPTSFSVTCQADGTYSAPGQCLRVPVICPASALMVSLTASASEHRDFVEGTSATYTCNAGHNVANTGATTFQVECLESGLFSSMSTCRNIDDCEGHSCGSNGRCVDGINEYTCDCESGFEVEEIGGELMCGNIDDCGAGACGGHGVCHDLVNGFHCECDTGYEVQGDTCAAKTCTMPSMNHVASTVASLVFPQTLYIDCAAGHDLGNGQTNFNVQCNANGAITLVGGAALPTCRASAHTITGRIVDSQAPTQGIPHATLAVAGQTITTDASGHYSVSLAQGTHTYQVSANGFITNPAGSLIVNSAGSHTISMSRQLAADSWRIVLTWDQNPRDLDSHLQFYNNRCPEMYYGRRTASCDGVTASLDVDDTSSWGPETTTLTNVAQCSGPWYSPSSAPCKWVYKVKNYSGHYDRNHGWQHSQAVVTLYNGNTMVREFEVNSNHGSKPGTGIGSPEYWSVLSIDGHGNVAECSNANCD